MLSDHKSFVRVRSGIGSILRAKSGLHTKGLFLVAAKDEEDYRSVVVVETGISQV